MHANDTASVQSELRLESYGAGYALLRPEPRYGHCGRCGQSYSAPDCAPSGTPPAEPSARAVARIARLVQDLVDVAMREHVARYHGSRVATDPLAEPHAHLRRVS